VRPSRGCKRRWPSRSPSELRRCFQPLAAHRDGPHSLDENSTPPTIADHSVLPAKDSRLSEGSTSNRSLSISARLETPSAPARRAGCCPTAATALDAWRTATSLAPQTG